MKKLAAIFFTLLFASTASAQVISNPTTNARMGGLGVDNWQIEDGFNIFINPAQLSNYKNEVHAELGSWGSTDSVTTHPFGGVNNDRINPWGGMNIDASYGGWGVYLGRPYSTTGPLTAMGVTPPAANRFDLFYATHGMPLGFYLSYASVSSETTSGGVKDTNQGSEINLGGGLLLNNMADVALNIGLPSSKCSNDVLCPGTTIKSDTSAAGNISLLGRLHTGMGGNAKLLTTAQILLADASLKGADQTGMTVRVDTALNSKPNPNTLLVAGVGIVSASFEAKGGSAKNTVDSLAIPVNVGVEHQTFKVVKTRMGLRKNIYDTTECKDSGGAAECAATANSKITTVADGNATMTMGFGWAIADNLSLDAVLNQDVLFTGTYVISGIPETLSSAIGVTYRMK